MTDFSPKFQKKKNPNWVEITEYHVLGVALQSKRVNKLLN
jgi:hypothetical protein